MPDPARVKSEAASAVQHLAHPRTKLTSPRTRLPSGIWALGLVSLFMDISSEMIHSLLPVFLVVGLGASTALVGIIEGVGEATAALSKMVSGWLSDRTGRRKALTLAGYGLGTAAKPLFAAATSAGWVLAARFSDRVGKGIRGAPRDALVAEIAPRELHGAAYGLRQSLDTVGAFAGPLLAIALMAASGGNFRLVFWAAVVPGVLSVLILTFGVREPARAPAAHARPPIRWRDVAGLPAAYWTVVAAGALLTLARFSEAFLILRAEGVGLPVTLAPLVLVVMNVVFAATAYPFGALSDRFDRGRLLAGGFGVLILADVVLAVAPGLPLVFVGVGLWGLHLGLTQGLLSTLIAAAAPAHLRGSAFGVFHLFGGISVLLASVIAGVLWDRLGPGATFATGAALTALGLAVLLAAPAYASRLRS